MKDRDYFDEEFELMMKINDRKNQRLLPVHDPLKLLEAEIKNNINEDSDIYKSLLSLVDDAKRERDEIGLSR